MRFKFLLLSSFTLLVSMFLPTQIYGQTITCKSGIYGVNSFAIGSVPKQRGLYSIDGTTGVANLLVTDLFGSGPAANATSKGTSAIALDPYNNVLYYVSRETIPLQSRIYSYNFTTGTFGTTSVPLPVGTSANFNKAAFNPIDRKLYIHNGGENNIYVYNPAQAVSATNPLLLGQFAFPGGTTTAEFAGGDIAFDGVGNLVAAFNGTTIGRIVVYSGKYDVSNNYLGIDYTNGKVLSNSSLTNISGVAFRSGGDIIAGFASDIDPLKVIDPITGVTTVVSPSLPFATSDLTSCDFPAPELSTSTKSAVVNCVANGTSTISYTISVKNTGIFLSNNTIVYDQIPAGLTVISGTLNGSPITLTNASLASGVPVNSVGAVSGVVDAGTSATLVIKCSVPSGIATYSNQAFIAYDGAQLISATGKVPTDDPNTTTLDDATLIRSNCLSLSGMVFNDSNGLLGSPVNTIDGTGTNLSGSLYANLLGPDSTVIATVAVNPDGTYNFSGITPGTYSVQITTVQGTAGQPKPATTLPTGWSNTAENIGTTGTEANTNGILSVTLTEIDITNANFSIEQAPESYDVVESVAGAPVVGNSYSLTDSPLQGSDPTDATSQTSWATKSISIESLPTNGFELYYDGVLITPAMIGTTGYVIPNYDPALLQLNATSPPDGTKTTSFTYSTIDAAGVQDPTPATFTLNFSSGLPITFGGIKAKIEEGVLVVNWSSLLEVNNDYFDIEISKDGRTFQKIGQLKSKSVDGNSTSPIFYEFSSSIGNLNMGIAGGSILGLLVLGLLLLFFKTKLIKVAMFVTLLVSLANLSCSKSKEALAVNGNKNLFIRIVQVDIDNTKSYSAVVKVINE